jgi:hypothetical protein
MKNEYLMKICTYKIKVITSMMSELLYSTFEILLFVMVRKFKSPSLKPLGNFLFKLDMFPMAKVPFKLLLSRFVKASNREKYVLVQGT